MDPYSYNQFPPQPRQGGYDTFNQMPPPQPYYPQPGYGGYDYQQQPSYQPPFIPQPGYDTYNQFNQMPPPQQGGYDPYNQFNQMPPSQPSYPQQGYGGNTSYNTQQQGYGNVPKKRALLIGINYFGTKSELRGCINDVKNIKSFLLKNGFSDNESSMRVLTDDQTNYKKIPNKQNMMDGMKWLVEGAQPGDHLFFHFSGHGSQQKDTDGDEDDGYDETICPVDYLRSGMIVDDWINKTLVQSLPPGCRLTFLADSCHSGTVLDLPYIYDSTGLIEGKHNTKKGSQASVMSFSGCLDSQTSSDTVINGSATGAMSYAFIKALNENPNISFSNLLKKMREILNTRNRFTQVPQLSTSHPMDLSYPFKM